MIVIGENCGTNLTSYLGADEVSAEAVRDLLVRCVDEVGVMESFQKDAKVVDQSNGFGFTALHLLSRFGKVINRRCSTVSLVPGLGHFLVRLFYSGAHLIIEKKHLFFFFH